MRCYGCFKIEEGKQGFCGDCQKLLFNGKNISSLLPFSLDEYDEKLAEQVQKNSIGGYQNKAYLALRSKQLIVASWAKSQYILKPVPYNGYRFKDDIPANEHLTMQLAKQVFNLPVAENALMQLEDKYAYLTKRFNVSAQKQLINQEDFTQIAQLSEENAGENYKYSISYERMADLIKDYSQQAEIDLELFFKILLFNAVVKNGDAHARNFSLYDKQGYFQLAPFYDLLNTHLHNKSDNTFACRLFEADDEKKKRTFDSANHKVFIRFGEKIGLNQSFIQNSFDEIAEKSNLLKDFIDQSFLSEQAKIVYKKDIRQSLHTILGIKVEFKK